LLLLLPALALCLGEKAIGKNKQSLGEVPGMMFSECSFRQLLFFVCVVVILLSGARYLLLLMSLGAIYTGFLYNECFALPMFARDSHWLPSTTPSQFLNFSGTAFPFGVDPAWKVSNRNFFCCCC
jgi:vacuolar-type H+-ATPase subunit I/STV1